MKIQKKCPEQKTYKFGYFGGGELGFKVINWGL
jgi:hypothetical protein